PLHAIDHLYFFSGPVNFDREQTLMRFGVAYFDMPIRQRKTNLSKFLSRTRAGRLDLRAVQRAVDEPPCQAVPGQQAARGAHHRPGGTEPAFLGPNLVSASCS